MGKMGIKGKMLLMAATIGEIAEQAAQLHNLAEELTEDMSIFRL